MHFDFTPLAPLFFIASMHRGGGRACSANYSPLMDDGPGIAKPRFVNCCDKDKKMNSLALTSLSKNNIIVK